jgi:hypothetical protein
MARAYVLIEMAPGQPSWVDDHAGSIGLRQCKGIYRSLWPNEVMLHLEGNDVDALGDVIASEIPKLKGVQRLTTCFVSKN